MKDLTDGNIYKNFITYGFPSVMAAIFSMAYNITNTIIAGKFLGAHGLAAIGATSALLSFASSLFWGFSAGAAMYVAALFGAKKYSDVKSSVYHTLSSTSIVSVLFAIITVVFLGPILSILQVDKSILSDAKIYVIIYMIGFVFIILSNTFVQIMHSFGMTSFPFYMTILSAILNIAVSMLSVTVFDLGIAGIGASTVISALTVDICYFVKVRKCFTEMGVSKEKVSYSKEMMRSISIRSFPVAFQQAVMYTASILVSPMVNAIGSGASASYSVVMQIYNLVAVTYQNSAKTVSTYTAHCVGAQKSVKHMKKGVFVGLLQGLLFTSVPILGCTIFAKEVCGLFFPKGYVGDGFGYALIFVRIYLPLVLLNLVNNLFHAFYRGTGTLNWLIFLTMLGAVVSLLAAFIVFIIGHYL